jgi:hypothetical protein
MKKWMTVIALTLASLRFARNEHPIRLSVNHIIIPHGRWESDLF